MILNRREFIKRLSLLLGSAALWQGSLGAATVSEQASQTGNFNYIYSDPVLRQEFFDFLVNVFHLYPENELHELIGALTEAHHDDQAIYQQLQSEIKDIKPFLSELRYAVPALFKQKSVMTQQTLQFLDPDKKYNGYLEMGSTGRYIGRLENKLKIKDDVFLLHTEKPGYSPLDILDREQIPKIGEFIDMGNYSSQFAQAIPSNSLDIVTVYIGFHHCPLEKREEFITSICDLLRPGGKLILRDHDAHNEDMRRMAALAHDTFNAGTNETWSTNQYELRNFYSMEFIVRYIEKIGLKHEGTVLFQEGDPTRNGLTSFIKV